MEKKMTGRETCYPTHPFSPTGDGVPWEETTGAENSKRDIEKIEKRFSYIWMLKALAIIFFVLAVLSFCSVSLFPNLYWHAGTTLLFVILFAFSAYFAGDIVSPTYSLWEREDFRNDGDGVWGRRDPASEYTNFSVPTLASVEEYDGGTVMFVNALYPWEGMRTLSPCCDHPNTKSLKIAYRSVLTSEYIDLGNETLEQEYEHNYDDTTVRLLTAKIVYASQRIEDIENYALDPTNRKWDQSSKPLTFEEILAYLDWYREYRETSLVELKKFLEQAHTERQAFREKLDIPENTENRWVCKPEEEQGVG
jgi:hypothetical protein